MLKSRRLQRVGHVPQTGDGRRVHKLLLGTPEGKCLPGRIKIRLEDNIIWGLKEVDYESDWKAFDQDRMTWHAYILAAINLHIL